MTKMASSNSAETTPQKHVALKIVGSICLLLSVANLIWGINLLSQVQFPEQINIYGFYEPARRYPTYEQNQIITCIGHVFSGLAWASYCFFFRASDRKVWKKILIFIYGLLMYVFYCSSIKFQEFGAKEGVAMGLFIIMTLLCIVFDGLKEQQLEQQDKQEGKSAVYTHL